MGEDGEKSGKISLVECRRTLRVENKQCTNNKSQLAKQFQVIEDWSTWLAEGEQTEERMNLRQKVERLALWCGIIHS
ncbi:MAG: hypothetical protein PF589_06325 [Gammaproteobacteria bacterium]|jgi:hypothetical protein|nr:hypothetical protein [Gammaproteobacteria bacterium]